MPYYQQELIISQLFIGVFFLEVSPMNNTINLKSILLDLIDQLDENKQTFLLNPHSDFSRKRKFSFHTLVNFILCLEAGSLKDELYKFFDYHLDTPTSSAFVQQRSKVSYEAFASLFHSFNAATYDRYSCLYKGYRLLAIDGSSVSIRMDPLDSDTYTSSSQGKGYNAFHLNASYDLLEHTYDDVILQGEAHKDENGAFNELVDRYKGNKAIFIADRGYESLNSFEHVVHSNNCFLIRVKDIFSTTSVTRSFGIFDDDEFDEDVNRILTRRATNEIKAHPEIYKFMPKNQKFDYMDKENPFYEFSCRIVRFKISKDTYECIITNLDRDIFPLEEIKKLYSMRWGIETFFREFKYAVDLNAFHSKKHNSIKQDIYARLSFYNFSERIMRKVKPKQSKKKCIHKYQINFTRAFHSIRCFLKTKKGEQNSPDIESIIAKEIEPIRPGRSDTRLVRRKPVVSFIYRLD